MNELKQELLPCPFNAGNPVIRPSNFGYYVSVQVPCEKYEYKEIWRTIYFQNKDDCIKFWNTRATLDLLSAPVGVPVGYMLDMWTLPYNSNDSDNRIRKVIDTLGLPNNSTGVWGALKQLENEIRHALVSDYNAAPTPAPTAVDLDALKRLLYPSIPRTYEDAIACATIDHIAAQFDFVRKV